MDSENSGIPATMLVGPTGYNNSNGFGFGGDWAWILLLLVLFGGNGWGNGFGGGFGNDLYPWMNNSQHISDGFRDQMINSSINGIQTSITSGFGDVQTALCNGFNQTQMGYLQGMNALQAQLAQCCCDNRAGIADLRYTVATEACADRAAVNDALRDVIAANTASTQRILDQLCQDKIDAKNEKIADLERQLTMANLAASQTAQTSRILADNAAQTVALEQYLNPVPVPAYVVQNPNCCANGWNGCGVA